MHACVCEREGEMRQNLEYLFSHRNSFGTNGQIFTARNTKEKSEGNCAAVVRTR